MFTIQEVMSVSCAAHRVNGFVKKADVMFADPDGPAKIANSRMLYNHFYGETKLEVTDADRAQAYDVIEYLKGLGFKSIERDLTDFEANTLKLVTSDKINSTSLGIAASLPNVYLNKLDQDTWEARETELARTSQYVGTEFTRHDFELVIENIRYIKSTSSHLYCCSEGGKNIVKFFSDNKIGKVGDTVYLGGFIKSHETGRFTNAPETMINRVKVYGDK